MSLAFNHLLLSNITKLFFFLIASIVLEKGKYFFVLNFPMLFGNLNILDFKTHTL